MTETYLDENKQIQAWLEWRKWCFIDCVKAPESFPVNNVGGEPVDELDKETRKRLHGYLSKVVCGKFISILHTYPNLCRENVTPPEIHSCFDLWMRGDKEGGGLSEELAGAPFSRVQNYKDFVFYKADNSKDPWLKVVLGMTLSSRGGYIKSIVSKYIRENFSTSWVGRPVQGSPGKVIKRLQFHKDISPLEENKVYPGEYWNRYEAAEQAFYSQKEGTEKAEQLFQLLDVRQRFILLAMAYKIPLSHPDLLAAVGVQKSASFALRDSIQRLVSQTWSGENSNNVLPELLKMIFFWVRTENTAAGLLYLIEQQEQGDSTDE